MWNDFAFGSAFRLATGKRKAFGPPKWLDDNLIEAKNSEGWMRASHSDISIFFWEMLRKRQRQLELARRSPEGLNDLPSPPDI